MPLLLAAYAGPGLLKTGQDSNLDWAAAFYNASMLLLALLVAESVRLICGNDNACTNYKLVLSHSHWLWELPQTV